MALRWATRIGWVEPSILREFAGGSGWENCPDGWSGETVAAQPIYHRYRARVFCQRYPPPIGACNPQRPAVVGVIREPDVHLDQLVAAQDRLGHRLCVVAS